MLFCGCVWARTRLIPDVLLVQFRPTALFILSSPLDYWTLDWAVVFLLFMVLPFIFFLVSFGFLFYLLFWRTIVASAALSIRVSVGFLFFFSVLWALLSVLTLLSWHSPEAFLFQGHVFFSETALSSSLVIIFLSITFPLAPITALTRGWFSEFTLLPLWFSYLLFFLFGVLFTSTNFFTFIFVVEFINLVVFLLLVISQLDTGLPDRDARWAPASSLLIFFWVNALASIMFFLLLLFASRLGWMSLFSQVDGVVYLLNSTANIIYFSFFIFSLGFIFFLKLGLPPFFFWKLRIFETVPFWFLVLYNLPYFFFLCLFFFNILNLGYYLSPLSASVINVFLLIFFLSILFLFFVAPSVSYFLVVSSGLTVLFLLFFNYAGSKPLEFLALTDRDGAALTFYIVLYSFLVCLFLIILSGNRQSGITTAGLTPLSTLNFLSVTSSQTFYRPFFFFFFVNIAGLPPTIVFFVKIRIIVGFFSSGISFVPALALFIIFLFISIFYYYRVVRVFFSPTGVVTRRTSAAFFSRPALLLSNSLSLYITFFEPTLVFFYLVMIFFLLACVIPSFIALDFFIYFPLGLLF